MHARAFSPHRRLRPARSAELVFLRERDADGRLRECTAQRRAVRLLLGKLAAPFLEMRAFEKLGYRTAGEYAAEHLGVAGRTVREWARVARGLERLPRLREAVLAGEISWTVARQVVGVATPEMEVACLETVRGRTERAVKEIVRAVREAEGTESAATTAAESDCEWVRIACTRREAALWFAALELARRSAGEELPVWGCAEAILAEAASTLGLPAEAGSEEARADQKRAREGTAACGAAEVAPTGIRSEAYPRVSWRPARAGALPGELAGLAEGISSASPRELARTLRAAVAFLQTIDLETGRILRQMQDRALFSEIGFSGLADYARELSLRGLEDEVAEVQAKAPRRVLAFRAPPRVARSFRVMQERAGGLERLLAHAIMTWVVQGEQFRDYADFARDGYRCTVPGCRARRNLHSHHVVFRSRGGPDAAWNRTTLCAYHHERALHREGTLRISGRAPAEPFRARRGR